jgi:hypothetical protein
MNMHASFAMCVRWALLYKTYPKPCCTRHTQSLAVQDIPKRALLHTQTRIAHCCTRHTQTRIATYPNAHCYIPKRALRIAVQDIPKRALRIAVQDIPKRALLQYVSVNVLVYTCMHTCVGTCIMCVGIHVCLLTRNIHDHRHAPSNASHAKQIYIDWYDTAHKRL